MFFEDWNTDADNLNHDLLCVEMSRLAYADAPAVTAALDRIGFSPVGFLGGESAEERIANRGTQGFVAKHAALGLTVLAFRGTESDKFEDLFSDLATVQTDFPGGGRIHSGFWKAYEPVRDRIANLLAQREGLLLITGHSLGAALATVAAAEVAPTKLITFGSPRMLPPGPWPECSSRSERGSNLPMLSHPAISASTVRSWMTRTLRSRRRIRPRPAARILIRPKSSWENSWSC